MKFRLKKRRLYANLILGSIWMVLGIVNLIFDENSHWSDYGYILCGSLYLGHFFYDLSNQYLRVENGILRKNLLYGLKNKIELNKVNWIKKFGGDYTLKTAEKELKINTDFMDEKSLLELNKILSQLDLPSEKTPFAKV